MNESSRSRDKKQKKKKSHKDDRKSKHKIEKKSKKKDKKRREKELKKRLQSTKKSKDKPAAEVPPIEVPIVQTKEPDNDELCGPSIDLMNRAKCPETKEQWEHRQSQIRRVVDPDTGRIRLIKGDGEVLEEIVPRDRHKQINQEATRNDGLNFQLNTVGLPSSTKFK